MAKGKDDATKPETPPESNAAADRAAEIELLLAENARLKAAADHAAADVVYARQVADKLHAELVETQERTRQQLAAVADYKPPAVTSGVILTQKLRETGTRKSLDICRRVLAQAEAEGRHPTADEVIDALIAGEAPNLTIAKAKMIRAEGLWEDRPAIAAVPIEDKFAIPHTA